MERGQGTQAFTENNGFLASAELRGFDVLRGEGSEDGLEIPGGIPVNDEPCILLRRLIGHTQSCQRRQYGENAINFLFQLELIHGELWAGGMQHGDLLDAFCGRSTNDIPSIGHMDTPFILLETSNVDDRIRCLNDACPFFQRDQHRVADAFP